MMKLIDQSFLLDAAKSALNEICLGMTQMCLFCLYIEWIGQTCNARYKMSAGMIQYLTLIPSVLILVRHACSFYVCHALSGCDATSYPYGKGNITALSTMVSRIYQYLAIIGDIDTTHTELMNSASFHYTCSQPPVTSMESTCYNIFTKRREILK